VRGGDPAAARPTGHPAAVHDVAVSSTGAPLAGALALHLLHRRREGIAVSFAFLAVSVVAYFVFVRRASGPPPRPRRTSSWQVQLNAAAQDVRVYKGGAGNQKNRPQGAFMDPMSPVR
jgi:hypothetical protein